jgi:uncharacterized protein YuzE
MTWRYDPEANAAYLPLSQEAIVESEEVREGMVLDFDAGGRIVGIEVLDTRAMLPASVLAPLAVA